MEFLFLDILGSCSLRMSYDDVSVIFSTISFLWLVVYHLSTEAVSFWNIVIVLSIGDYGKSPH
jgi:hypothetical protein